MCMEDFVPTQIFQTLEMLLRSLYLDDVVLLRLFSILNGAGSRYRLYHGHML